MKTTNVAAVAVVLLASSLVSGTAAAEMITIEAARQQLEAANEDWQIAAVRIERSRTLRRQAVAALLPTLSAGASTTYNGEEVSFGDRVVRRQLEWSASASASVTVFDGSAYPLVGRADHLVEATELESAWRRRTLHFELEAAYWQLHAAQMELAIAQRAVQLRTAYAERARALEQSGIALPLDVARADAQRLEAEQLVLEDSARLGAAADAVAVLLGFEPDGTLRAASPARAAKPESATAAPRSDVEALRAREAAWRSAETSQWWKLAPRIDLRSDLRAGPPSFSAPTGVTWSVSLAAVWVLYDGGFRYARVAELETEAQEVELRIEQTERRARAELAQALRDWSAAFESTSVAEQQVEVATQAYEMTVARFDQGLATSIEVTEASDTLFTAESNLNRTRLRTMIAAARHRYLEGL